MVMSLLLFVKLELIISVCLEFSMTIMFKVVIRHSYFKILSIQNPIDLSKDDKWLLNEFIVSKFILKYPEANTS